MRDTRLAQFEHHSKRDKSLIGRLVCLDFENFNVTHFIRARTRDAAARIAEHGAGSDNLRYSLLPARRCVILGWRSQDIIINELKA